MRKIALSFGLLILVLAAVSLPHTAFSAQSMVPSGPLKLTAVNGSLTNLLLASNNPAGTAEFIQVRRCGKVWVPPRRNRYGRLVGGHWRNRHWVRGHYGRHGRWVPGHCA